MCDKGLVYSLFHFSNSLKRKSFATTLHLPFNYSQPARAFHFHFKSIGCEVGERVWISVCWPPGLIGFVPFSRPGRAG